jgi:hypothetical protein
VVVDGATVVDVVEVGAAVVEVVDAGAAVVDVVDVGAVVDVVELAQRPTAFFGAATDGWATTTIAARAAALTMMRGLRNMRASSGIPVTMTAMACHG